MVRCDLIMAVIRGLDTTACERQLAGRIAEINTLARRDSVATQTRA